MKTKTYTIMGQPIPWKRPGHAGTHFYDQQHHERLAWSLFLLQQHGNAPMFDGPLFLEIIFYMRIPINVKKRSKCAWHMKIPDSSNLLKFVEDSITDTGTIWKDDCVVSKTLISKIYDKEPRTEITISELI